MSKNKYQRLTHPIVFNSFFMNKYFVADFLNATEKFNIREEDIIIENTKQYESVDLKVVDLDVVLRVIEDKTTFINLEMQNHKPDYDILDRIEHYLGRLMNKSEPRGKGYQCNKSVVVAIFDFTMFHDDRCLRTFKFKDEENNERETNIYIVLELTKANLCNKIKLKEWLDVFNNKTPEIPVRETELMKKVSEEIRRLSDDPMFQHRLDLYECHEAEREYEKQIAIEKATAEGLAQGMAQGMAQGIAQGISQGIAQGVTEGEKQKSLDIAKSMKNKGFDVSIILELTGLTKEEIENL